MPETISDYFTQQQRIKDLQKQVEVQRTLKYKAIASRDKARESSGKTVNVLLRLCNAGKLELTNQEIADICFITKRSVIDARSRLKRNE